MVTPTSDIYYCITTMLRLSGLKRQVFTNAYMFTGQPSGFADLGKAQPVLAGLLFRSMSIGRVAGGWQVCNDLTHIPGTWLVGSWGGA